jgi:UDP-N-acetylglucosamine 2-epimerase (non-hydrolysing)
MNARRPDAPPFGRANTITLAPGRLRNVPSPDFGAEEGTVVHVVGARPNFVKMAPLIEALRQRSAARQVVVHTGQHYDRKMSEEILEDLSFPAPDHSMGIGSGSHGEQTGKVLIAFEQILLAERPALVVVAGDVNSTLACALAAAKLQIPIAHLEAGLRSGDWTMPEEINRVLTDRLSDVLLTHSPEAEENLEREGVDTTRVRYVGNTMIDSLRRFESAARSRAAWTVHGVPQHGYVLVTLHRPSNVDEPGRLAGIVDELCRMAKQAPIVFPIHPRTRARLAAGGDLERLETAGVRCADPVGYLDFLSLQGGAGIIVTDSGGVQEEASALGVPCYTLRANTERPVTIARGTNVLLGDDPASLRTITIAWRPATPCAIPLWDGHAADRAADALLTDYPALVETRRAA